MDAAQELALYDRCWKDGDEWMTNFAPPAGFDGYQNKEFGSRGYNRTCTPEESEILEADLAAARAEERAEADNLRDTWFGMLKR